jgi:hypothetical protein
MPAVPSVITAARSREEASESVIDALMEILAVERGSRDADGERIRLDGSIGRKLDREFGRGR